MVKKCFSHCRKKPFDDCKTRFCNFTNGKTRKYCRLSSKYKLDKECNVIKKPITKSVARKRIQNFIISKKTKSPKHLANKTIKKNPGKLIANFMFKKRHKIKAEFLKSICSDSGFCIALGNEAKKITDFFDGFINFKYATGNVKNIGSVSANGFVKEFIFEREGYKSYAILKSSQLSNSDSLVFEYMVGRFINTLIPKFPCFVKTYGLLKYVDIPEYNRAKKNNNTSIDVYKQYLHPVPDTSDVTLLNNSCNPEAKLYCVLIEHISKPSDIRDLTILGNLISNLASNDEKHQFTYELPYCLYQLYFTLNCLKTQFTHYDLHTGNVLLYKPVEYGYITYHYHSGSKVITFESQYIIKIIDYGRSFFSNLGTNTSKHVVDTLCDASATPNCNHHYTCGNEFGYNFTDKIPDKSKWMITSYIKNESHDLRYLNQIKDTIPDWSNGYKQTKLCKLLKKVKYGKGIKNINEKDYGTEENLSTNAKDIFNVTQAYQHLEKLLEEIIPTDKMLGYPYFEGMTIMHHLHPYHKLGDLYIYDDGRNMNYRPA